MGIRTVFEGLPMLELDIKYTLQREGEQQTSGELVITNLDTESSGGLFDGM